MKNKTNTEARPTTDDVDLMLLKDLEQQSIEEIRKLRSNERMDTKVRLVIQSGDSSRAGQLRAQAYTSDISASGCCVISSVPIGVGDIYRLSFDSSQLDVPLVFARCVRCRLLREEAFEAAFAFFSDVSIASLEDTSQKDLLS